jgi:urease accessory protein
MLDASDQTQMQRSHGRAMVRFALRAGRMKLTDLAQSGSGKAMLPRVFGSVPEAVFMNISGGLTGGDSLEYHIQLEAGARLTATTQTAERAYATSGDSARVRVQADVGAGAHLDWLPQETILFEAAHVTRKTEIDLAEGASALLVESLVLGRHAMGEVPRHARLTDHRMIRRNGRPFWAETLLIDKAVLANAPSPAILGGARALAVIAFVAQNAEDAASALRALPIHDGAEMAASGWNGRCLIRITATDGWPLRAQIIRIITTLRAAPMPRVWQC